jgi:hypothetical protein
MFLFSFPRRGEGAKGLTLKLPGCAEARSASFVRFYQQKHRPPPRKRKTLVLPATEQPKEEGATKKPPPDLNNVTEVSLHCPSRQ